MLFAVPVVPLCLGSLRSLTVPGESAWRELVVVVAVLRSPSSDPAGSLRAHHRPTQPQPPPGFLTGRAETGEIIPR